MGWSVLDGETVFGDGRGVTFGVFVLVRHYALEHVVVSHRPDLTDDDVRNLGRALFEEAIGRPPLGDRLCKDCREAPGGRRQYVYTGH